MNKIDPIIAVENVGKSAEWFEHIFGWKRSHGGDEFAVLKEESGDIMLCLHRWGTHHHPTMTNSDLAVGNGIILYFKTDRLDKIRQNVNRYNLKVEEDIHVNPNSGKEEFSIVSPDGYFIIITEFHEY
jgi:hypothetical protein